MDTTEKDIRSLFANTGELDRDEVALLLLQLVERIQNLENTQQRTWVGLQDWEIKKLVGNDKYSDLLTAVAIAIEKELKARNT